MIVATILFIVGSFWYKKPPPKDNIFGEVFRLGAVRYKAVHQTVANMSLESSGEQAEGQENDKGTLARVLPCHSRVSVRCQVH